MAATVSAAVAAAAAAAADLAADEEAAVARVRAQFAARREKILSGVASTAAPGMKSGVRQKHLCGAASGAAARATLGGCVDVPHVCIRGEQLLLHGSLDALPDVMRLLNRTRDPSDAFSLLRPYERPTALPPPDGPYDYLPIAVGARRSRGRRRPRFLVRAPAPPRNVTFSDDDAVVFFTSWSNSFTEIFSRAVVRWPRSSGAILAQFCAILAQFWRNANASC